MAKFLDTTGVSYRLENLIKNAKERLILISPYLKFNDRIKEFLSDQNNLKIDIRLVYGKNELQPEENNWLKNLRSIRASFCQNLHAKCYLNENAAIITSMNLYEFSQQHNNEMGVFVQRDEEPELYQQIYDEAMRLVRISDEIEVTVTKKPKENSDYKSKGTNGKGHCIRCDTEIALNPLVPYCKKCYNSWKRFSNEEYVEKTCHICGKENPSTILKPTCYPCFKANKSKLEFVR